MDTTFPSPLAADRLVLVAGIGPETVAAILVFAIACIAVPVSLAMARRGHVEAWSLPGLFGLLALAAVYAAAHAPTRLVIDRHAGAEVAFGPLLLTRPWREIGAVEVERGRLGLWMSIARAGAPDAAPSLWPFGSALLAPDEAASPHPRTLGMQIEAWRLAAQRE